MLRFFALACLVGSLVGCAAPPSPVPVAAAPVEPPADQGTILAMHPVPAHDARPVRHLLRGLGGGAAPAGTMEFIVRSDDGDVIAVVQQGQPALKPGSPVRIAPGPPTRISPGAVGIAGR